MKVIMSARMLMMMKMALMNLKTWLMTTELKVLLEKKSKMERKKMKAVIPMKEKEKRQ